MTELFPTSREVDQVESYITSKITAVLGFSDPDTGLVLLTTVRIALDGLRKHLPKEKLVNSLSGFLEAEAEPLELRGKDGPKEDSLRQKLLDRQDDKSRRPRDRHDDRERRDRSPQRRGHGRDDRRGRERDHEREREREREKERERDRGHERRREDRPDSDRTEAKSNGEGPTAPSQPIDASISESKKELQSEIQTTAEQQIAEKQRKMMKRNLLAKKQAMYQAERAADIREDKKPNAKKQRFRAMPLLVDEEGREIDEHGNLVVIKKMNIATTLANKKAFTGADDTPQDDIMATGFFDASIPVKERRRYHSFFNLREPRGFDWVRQGTFQKKGEALRAKQMRADLEKAMQNVAADSVELPEARDIRIAQALRGNPPVTADLGDVPPVSEWWDEKLLRHMKYSDLDEADGMVAEECTIYVEHPVPIPPPGADKVKPLTLMLTKNERKKLRRQTRAERLKEEHEEVLLGLREPPKPKVRIANMVRVMTNDAIMEPTALEKEVRKQEKERVARHDARNQARKLSKEDRKEKRKKKLLEDAAKGIKVLVFKVLDLSHPQKRFKVDATAQKMHMTGCCLLHPKFALVIVEGGARAIRKFKRLMTQRINWKDNPVQRAKEGEEQAEKEHNPDALLHNECYQVWEGSVPRRGFRNFRFETVSTDSQAKLYLGTHQVAHYFDTALNYQGDPVTNTVGEAMSD